MERLTDLTEARWTSGTRAKDAKGRWVAPLSDRAIVWCALGWYDRVTAGLAAGVRAAILQAMASYECVTRSVGLGERDCYYCNRSHVASTNDAIGWRAAEGMLAAGQAAWDEATGVGSPDG